jgi:hypothetical protein
MTELIKKIGSYHARFFAFVSMKAKTSKMWAILLTLAVLYEIVEHTVWPILVPYLAYQHWFN